MNTKKIGTFMKELRNSKNITQEQFAEKLGVSGRTVSRWETGTNLPDLDLLIEMADFYDVDIRELLDGERKSENMTEEVKETAQKVADYAEHEKSLLLKRARLVSVIGLVTLLVGVLMQSVSSNSLIPVYECVKGICFGLSVGALITMVLYTTGLLAKIHAKKLKNMKIVAIVAFSIVVLCFAASIIYSVK